MSTIFSRKNDTSAVSAVVQQYNALHEATISTTTDGYHRDISGVPGGDFRNPTSVNLQVSATNASDLASSLVLVLNEQGVLAQHFADDAAHLMADTVNVAFDGYAVDNTNGTTQLSSAIAMANAMKLDYNAHLTQSGVHRKSDTANNVSTSDATDLTSLETLLNAMKTKVNAHIVSGPTVGRVKLVDD